MKHWRQLTNKTGSNLRLFERIFQRKNGNYYLLLLDFLVSGFKNKTTHMRPYYIFWGLTIISEEEIKRQITDYFNDDEMDGWVDGCMKTNWFFYYKIHNVHS